MPLAPSAKVLQAVCQKLAAYIPTRCGNLPQGLKPAILLDLFGSTKVARSYKTI